MIDAKYSSSFSLKHDIALVFKVERLLLACFVYADIDSHLVVKIVLYVVDP